MRLQIKNQLIAKQLSKRRGEIKLAVEGETVFIEGQAVGYLKGQIMI
ncbi:hypothetical protein [Catenovulum sediminis]|uniref:Uncharacterized protein n=1 Tax=Catenovulum sediminis TaxID=1740262 RepID=A0ABV1RKZ9_9ALTE